MQRAPFPPLLANAEGLDAPPAPPAALRRRMADVYGVDESAVLPVRGAWHGMALLLRLVAAQGVRTFAAPDLEEIRQLARITGFSLAPPKNAGAIITAADDIPTRDALRTLADPQTFLLVDESFVEFTARASLCTDAAGRENLIVLRSLSFAYGLAGAPCAALIAQPALIARMAEMLEPEALPTPIVRLAEAALDPSRTKANDRRVEEIVGERARLAAALADAEMVSGARDGQGPWVDVTPRDEATARENVRKLAVPGAWRNDGVFRLEIRDANTNDRALAAFGANTEVHPRRRAEVVRETLETRIVAQVDLDAPVAAAIDTGVGFFDHMLSQVALHGGFGLALSCAGDLDVDTHHTIEDCALALGQALKQALGTKRGIARFGFVLPMDEAEAKVSVDLGGRPYLVFEGAFKAPLIGEYPTEMTEHVFRSLAQSMGAAIHVAVTGENDHHKTEACFKAFGRALRQAVLMEGEALPSTKGAIA